MPRTVIPEKSRTPKPKAITAEKSNLDLDPDAWPKFEALVKSAAKMGHKPHVPKPTKKRNRKA